MLIFPKIFASLAIGTSICVVVLVSILMLNIFIVEMSMFCDYLD